MSIGKRIAELIALKEISNASLARSINVSRPTTGNWIDGSSEPTGKNLNNLANALGVEPNWLLTGDSQPKQVTPFRQVESWDSSTPLEDDEVEIPFYKDFKFACGKGKFGDEVVNETRRLRISKSTLRARGIEFINASAATATDNSMSPTINDGATIFIDCGKTTIKNGQIFIIQHGEGEFADFRCKRLYTLPMGGVRIVSDNAEEYPEERLTAQEIKDQHFVVLGWVFSVQQLFTW